MNSEERDTLNKLWNWFALWKSKNISPDDARSWKRVAAMLSTIITDNNSVLGLELGRHSLWRYFTDGECDDPKALKPAWDTMVAWMDTHDDPPNDGCIETYRKWWLEANDSWMNAVNSCGGYGTEFAACIGSAMSAYLACKGDGKTHFVLNGDGNEAEIV